MAGALAAALAIGALLLAAGQVVSYQASAIAYPYPLDYGEGPLLDQARRLLSGQPIYPVPDAASPWTVSNYPPLYPVVEAVFGAFAGPAYWYGRLVSALALAVGAVSAAFIVARLGRDWIAGVVAGLALVAVPYVGHWSGLARIDTLALGLSIAGLAVLVATQEASGRRRRQTAGLLVAVVLLVAAAYTRQSYVVAAPLAGLLWLARSRGRRPALAFAGVGLAGLLLPGLALNLASDGGFWFNIVTANVNTFRPDAVASFAADVVGRVPVLIGAAVIGLALAVASRRRGRVLPGAWLAVPYLAGGLVSAATIGKIGSNINYLLELSAALCVITGLVIAGLRPHPRVRMVLLGLVAVQAVLWALAWPSYAYLARATADRQTPARLLSAVRSADGPVLGDEVMGLLPLAGRPIAFQPFELTQLARDGLWDQQPLLADIYSQRYALIAIHTLPNYPIEQERWTEEMLAAISTAYTPVAEIGDGAYTIVYEPTR